MSSKCVLKVSSHFYSSIYSKTDLEYVNFDFLSDDDGGHHLAADVGAVLLENSLENKKSENFRYFAALHVLEVLILVC